MSYLSAQNLEPNRFKRIPKKRLLMVVVAGMCLLFGLILISRALFSEKLPDSSIKVIDNGEKVSNFTPSESIAETKIVTFGENISTPFNNILTSGQIILSLRNSSLKSIYEFKGDEAFEKLYDLLPNSKLLKIYSDYSAAFVQGEPFESEALMIVKKGEFPTELLKSVVGESISSFQYNPTDKLFYYSTITRSGIVKIFAQGLNGQNFKLFESTFLNNSSKILFSNSENVYISHSPVCQILILKDLVLKEIDCADIQVNINANFYTSNKIQNASGLYTSYISGEIYNEKPSADRVLIRNLGTSNVVNNMTYLKNNLFIVQGKLTPVTASSWNPADYKLSVVNLTDLSVTDITEKLPDGYIEELFETNGKYYTILNINSKRYLFAYIPEGFSETKFGPTSYSSTPISYPVTKYWKEINFSKNYEEIELLGDKYVE